MNHELYLKTAFCCMACDGDIADEEINLIKHWANENELFKNLDIIILLQNYIDELRIKGGDFLKSYIKEVADSNLEEHEELQLIKVAIEMIEADMKVEYSEISFFKKVRRKLRITDETILAELPDKEDYLLPDIVEDEIFDTSISFDNISINSLIFQDS